ncbi:MAG: molecular chaperone TorD family protein [Thermoleophilia bacterium]|nr:molecular chaperone TorD family protein [Thermoleophilia bacterium]MDH4339878.1 molecular chaperone TorD family protein [Thermoleophilia bacterium]MDH5280496.1 molecular chaperone TorD family protein [Thermoleophilia bacterium]
MTVVASPEVRLAALWRLLSLGFTSPTTETVAEVEALAEGVLETESSRELEDVLSAVRACTVVELATNYNELFGGTVRVAPYEGSYELDPIRQGRQMADVAAFYRAFGAEPSGPAGERPDHVGCELEFLSFLELRRLTAVEASEDVELLDEITASFLTDHAGRWLPTFFAAVREAATRAALYRALASLGERTIGDEIARRSLEPTALPRRHSQHSVEADSFECGASDAAPSRVPR